MSLSSIRNIEEEVGNLNIGAHQLGTENTGHEFTTESLSKGGASLKPHKSLASKANKQDFIVIEQVSDRSTH